MGQNMKNMLEFAKRLQGRWHGYATDGATMRALNALEKRGFIEVNRHFQQFRLVK